MTGNQAEILSVACVVRIVLIKINWATFYEAEKLIFLMSFIFNVAEQLITYKQVWAQSSVSPSFHPVSASQNQHAPVI